MIVTTSWDDGHALDERVAGLLAERGLKGTFYIPFQHPECGQIQPDLVRRLQAMGTEIGAHSMTHPDLRRLPSAVAQAEARSSKVWLEQIIGAEVPSFAFPFGYHNRRVAHAVAQAGFTLARTLRYDHLRRPTHGLLAGVSVQAADASPLLVTRTWLDVRGPRGVLTDWSTRAKRAFDVARQRDGIWHLWGHSWEIERNHDWPRLVSVLDYVAGVPGVQYLTNGQALRPGSHA